jgi:hypothetical protein
MELGRVGDGALCRDSTRRSEKVGTGRNGSNAGFDEADVSLRYNGGRNEI